MPKTDDQAPLLALLGHPSYRPLKLKAIARKLKISQPRYLQFKAAVRELVRQGRIELRKDHTLKLTPPHGTVTGIFRSTSAGFGFVRPHVDRSHIQQDIYIPAEYTSDAARGDEVLVRITRRPHQPGRKPEGRVIEVLERASQQFVGTYLEQEDRGYVRVDGTTFADPVYVGDPGAKGAKPGDKVVFEMLRFPSPGLEGEGVITEILGPRGQPGVDTLSIIREFNLPDRFPEDALEEARAWARLYDEQDLEHRRDLTAETIVTIDPVDARDFDDAISLRRDKQGRWLLGVHIADVSHFVRPGTPLDREARKRGTSVYLPDRVLPMLPEVISNGLASLQQGVVRYTKSVVIEFTPDGARVATDFTDSAIKVTKRFAYEQVSAILAEPQNAHGKLGAKVRALLWQMKELAMILRRRRTERGALELWMPEVKIDLDSDGRVQGAHFVPHDVSHQIIEEFMLAANEAVAEHLADHDVLFLRRVHGEPDPQKLKAFAEFAEGLGFRIRKPQSRFELQRVLTEAFDRPEAYAVNYALLRSLKQAQYSPEEEGHYALASNRYCHFTSPIRRYPDLTVHRLLAQLTRAGRVGSDEEELVALGEHCTLTERRSERAERELTKVKLLEYLKDKIGLELTTIITGVEEYGFFSQSEEFPIEGLVHVSTLSEDYYYLDSATHTLVGRRTGRQFRLGDKVSVRVARVDVDRRQLDFQVVRRRGAR